MTNKAENQIARLTLQSRLDFLPGALAFVREITGKLGLTETDVHRLELVAEEATVNVIEHAFEGETGTYDIVITRRPGQVVVGVEDRGLPFDFRKYEEGSEPGLGVALMKAFADEVRFLNLGRAGKRVELVKNLPEKDIESYLREIAGKPDEVPVMKADYSLRLMRPDESASLARCAYRVYGYTYSTDNFYFPERVRELIQSGLMISVIAVTPEGEIIGHVSVVKDSPEALVGEIGQAIVDPRYRGHGLLDQMMDLINEAIKADGILGTFAEGVTVHPYSQKSALSHGYVETGLLLGFTPATMYFKAIQGDDNRKRRPAVFFYKRVNEEAVRDVYLPSHHAGILRRIYEHSGLKRNYGTRTIPELPELSQVNVKVQTEASRAYLQVMEYGQDLEDLVRFRLRELCTQRIDCIFLDLPLTQPATQRYCASMEMLGFFFGGILPELNDRDVLRLQYVNNAELELQDVQLASNFSKELFQYVLPASGL